MGLFDQYQFEQGSYGGGGSLIDRLLSQLQTQGQYEPAQGFGSNPMDANAQMPSQAMPIAVGNVQMPRIGDAAQFDPQQVNLPPNAQPTQGHMPIQPQASSLPAFLQPSAPGNNLLAGLESFANSDSIISGVVNGLTGLATGQRNDPRARQQQALQAEYKALVPILGEQRAALAVLNPEMGKALLSQALAGKQYQFTTAPDGTVIRTDAHAGTAEPVYQAGLKPTFGVIGEQDGTKTYGWIDPSKRSTTAVPSSAVAEDKGVMGPDGKMIPYPEGVDRKTFRNEISKINADAAGGKKTEVQAKDERFANKMENAEKNLKNIEDEGTGYLGRSAEGFPLIGGTMATNWMKSDKYQQYEQARNNFITALLRDESGAAIGTAEFNRYEKELFPQPGDGESVIKQKREARRIAIEGMKKGAGPGYKSPTFAAEVADPLGIR